MTSQPEPTGEAAEIAAELRRVLAVEREALSRLEDRLDAAAVQTVELLCQCRGRIIVTGVGKAGLVARKTASTFTSTGLPAFFLHAVEATHGDLGVVADGDLALCFSNSGETDEVLSLVPHLKRLGVTVIAVTGNTTSSLAAAADLVLDVGVAREADVHNLIPTASTTAMIALGDALACATILRRQLTQQHFADVHPGGALGRRLLILVADLMHPQDQLPLVSPEANIREAIAEATRRGLGVVFIVGARGELQGIFTDGDIRRLLEKVRDPLDLKIADQMTRRPKCVHADVLASAALKRMNDAAITVLPVLDADDNLVGALHLHDLLRARVS